MGREEEQKRTDVLQTVSIERLVIYKVCKSRDSAIEEERLYQGDRKNSCFWYEWPRQWVLIIHLLAGSLRLAAQGSSWPRKSRSQSPENVQCLFLTLRDVFSLFRLHLSLQVWYVEWELRLLLGGPLRHAVLGAHSPAAAARGGPYGGTVGKGPKRRQWFNWSMDFYLQITRSE